MAEPKTRQRWFSLNGRKVETSFSVGECGGNELEKSVGINQSSSFFLSSFLSFFLSLSSCVCALIIDISIYLSIYG